MLIRFRIEFNTGFLIMHNTPKLTEVLQQWLDCPDKVSIRPFLTEF